jgi:hypothetical protein
MKPFCLILILTLITFNGISQSSGVRGHVIVNAEGDSAVIREHMMVWLAYDEVKYWITGLDSNFNFYFGYENLSLKPDTTEIRFTTVTRYADTIVKNVIVAEDKETYIEISYPPYCEYTQTKHDSICPVCKKSDESVPIIYQDYAGWMVQKKYKRNFYFDKYPATGCDPNWYCRRDKKRF